MCARVLHRIFETQADLRPDAVAIHAGDERTTYLELEHHANRLARILREQGVRRGARVAVLLPRSMDAYAALLGVLKAGAAYVPLDPQHPRDRSAYVLDDCDATALVTTADLAKPHAGFRGAVVCVDADRAVVTAADPSRLPPDDMGVGPRDLCYVIYTSGSTGRPKGVMVEHRSVCHLVRAEADLFAVRPTDRVYQGFSLSFDASVEEIWLAFCAGATLVPATPDMEQAGPDLSRFLSQAGVTVLSCVPTLLAMLPEDVPSVRLLILGGERCPDQLVARWARSGRRLVNTYGPTEATVIATYADLVAGKPVTIGRPVPGYRVYLMDDSLRPVPPGVVGEICIGGSGVARGYVGLPGHTRERFVPDPQAGADDPDARIYRTGDLGRLDGEGNIEFHGRADAQVKIRGFRVELAEIESVLLEHDAVGAAACALHESGSGSQCLVGYVVPRAGASVQESDVRARLHRRLPPYMVPSLIETVTTLPRLPSGKLDRAALPAPRAKATALRGAGDRPRTGTERRIAQVCEKLFHPQRVSVHDHFFLDLGGHSLLAARLVSELRKDPRFAGVSVRDVYQHPTVATLASALDAARLRPSHSAPHRPPRRAGLERATRKAYVQAGILQAAGLFFVFGFRALQWVTPYALYFLLLADGHRVLTSAAWAGAAAMAVFPTLLLLAIAAKWLVLGRVQPGRYPLWGAYYLRWWFVQALVSALPLGYLARTPLLSVVYRLFGARIGRDVHLGTDRLAAFDLISIGDGASIDDDASLLGYTVEDEELVLGSLRVGRGCFVGVRAVLCDGTVMEDRARLEDLSLLLRGARIPRGETWAGSPARRIPRWGRPDPAPPARSPVRRAATAVLYAALVPVISTVLLAASAPGVAFLTYLNPIANPFRFLAAAPLVGGVFVLLLTTEVVFFKWLLVGRVRAGRYPVHGSFYVRNWIVDQLLALSLDYVGQLHATLYLAPWYRALGARLGRFVELSTASATSPDLVELGDESTVADEVSLGSARVEGGWMHVAPTRLGRRAFLGNSAVVPAGTAIGDGSLVGVLSIAPAAPDAARPGASWLGSPPISLPRRQPSAAFPEDRTFRPTRRLRLARGAIEILRVTLPAAGFILVTAAVLIAALTLWDRIGPGATLLLLPCVYAACCAGAVMGVALVKWIVMGRYRPFVQPLWSTFVWRLELVNALYEFFATPLALDALRGTPFLPWYLRLLGARIGRRVYINTTGFLEWDLVEIGDRTALNEDGVLQTHLFEDRVLKASRLRIGADCVVGTASVVLYDAAIEPRTRLDALSLVMKGETLPAGSAWAGIPASRMSGAHGAYASEHDDRRTAASP